MANLIYQIDPQFARMMEKMTDFETFAPKILTAGGNVLLTAVKVRLKQTQKDGAGELYKSIRLRVFNGKYGWFASINPVGYSKKALRKIKGQDDKIITRKNPVANAQKLAALEYGTRHQNAKPFIQAAINDATPEMDRVMQQVFEEEALDGR